MVYGEPINAEFVRESTFLLTNLSQKSLNSLILGSEIHCTFVIVLINFVFHLKKGIRLNKILTFSECLYLL